MGFPVSCSELLLPKFFLHAISLLGILKTLVSLLFRCLGLSDFLDSDIPLADHRDHHPDFPQFDSVSAVLMRELLPVVKYSELDDPPESCAVCLYEFAREDEIRWLANCQHVFHMGCLDRWMAYERKTCPLCRKPFIPADLQGSFNERLWAASGIPEFYGEYSDLDSGL